MCKINCSGGCIECAPEEHSISETFDIDFLVKRRITNNSTYPGSEARFLSVKEYIISLEDRLYDLKFFEGN